MRRREPSETYGTDSLPTYLRNGPCVEDWSDDGRLGWFAAWRRWQAAIDGWGAQHGYDAPGYPRGQVRDLARTARAWSRDFLISEGRQDLVDFYDGTRPERPEHLGWLPQVGRACGDAGTSHGDTGAPA
jgi:hypothetical protein